MKTPLPLLVLLLGLPLAGPVSLAAASTYQQVLTKLAVDPISPDDAKKKAEGETDAAEQEEAAEETVEAKLKGLGFGSGIAAIHMFGDRAVDTAAADENKVLRVTYKSRARAGAVLVTHISFGDPRVARGARTNSNVGRAVTDAIDTAKKQALVAKAGPRLTRTLSDELPAIVSEKKYSIQTREKGITVMVEVGENVVRSVGVGGMYSIRHYDIEVKDAELEIKPRGTAFNLSLVALIEPDVKVLARGFEADKVVPTGTGTTIPFDKEPRFGVAAMFSASW